MPKVRISITEACKQRGVSVNRLAEILDLDPQTLYFWNQGRHLPRLPMLLLLARTLEMPLNDLLKDTSNDAKS